MPKIKKTAKNKADEVHYETQPVVVTKQNNVPLYVFMGALILLVGFMFYKMMSLEKQLKTAVAGNQPPEPIKLTKDMIKPLFKSGFLRFGDDKRKVLFVEASDPSCPYCHIAGGRNPEIGKDDPRFLYVSEGGEYVPPVPEMKKLVDEGKASYVMLYAPGHGNGELATQALYCAYDKNKFWEVDDKLMSNAGYELINNVVKNDVESLPKLTEFLADVIDPKYLEECISSKKYADKLNRDYQLAQSLGYQGTPYFIVNTTPFPGAYSFKDMKSVVDEALK